MPGLHLTWKDICQFRYLFQILAPEAPSSAQLRGQTLREEAIIDPFGKMISEMSQNPNKRW